MRKSSFSLIASLGVMIFASSAHADIVSYAQSTNPLAFFPLQSSGQGSVVGGYTTTYQNGAGTVLSGGGPQANAASFNGVNSGTPQYISTSLSGGIAGSGSLSAFINLTGPTGSIEYIAGESQDGNDFDLQLIPVNSTTTDLCFYTQSGSDTCAALAYSALEGKWNMVTATDNATTGVQDVYVNGVLVATATNGSNSAKVDSFNIGYTPTFGGRDFEGDISDVGIWDYALSSDQVLGLYDSVSTLPPGSATPEPSSLVLLSSGMLGLAGAVRRRFKR
jgi:Concanavalin A-like lectin/glucanases superfamily/PEP-CTERM motif